jgi:hypothetical protein
MRAIRLVAILFGLAAAAPALAQEVVASKPETIAAALEAAGYPAKLLKDKVGDPLIESRTPGHKFQIFFHDCDKGANCTQIEFSSGFVLPRKKRPSLARINGWNFDNVVTKASLDKEGDPYISAGFSLRKPVPQSFLVEFIHLWSANQAEFIKAFVD